MAEAVYEFSIDLTGDRDYGDSNEDISAFVMEAEWQLGATKPGDLVAKSANAKITVNNSGNEFSPEHGSAFSGLDIGSLLRIRSTFSAVTRQHFIGWITDIRPAPGSKGERTAEIIVDGWFDRLLGIKARLAVQEGKTADQIIDALIVASNAYPPGTTGWSLGIVGFSELGDVTVLGAGAADYSSLDTGITAFNYAGDNWERGVSIRTAFKDVMIAEYGFLLWVNRDGKLVFKNRHYEYLDQLNAVDATLTDSDISGIKYEYGQDIINDLRLGIHPRKVGTTNEQLVVNNNATRIPAGTTKTIKLSYSDSTGNRIGGRDVVEPVEATDYTANSQADGTGTDKASSVSMTVAAEFATSVEIDVSIAAGAGDVYVLNLQPRGIKITDYGKQDITSENEASKVSFGDQPAKINAKLLDVEAGAQDLADWIVESRKDPTGTIQKASFFANRDATLMVVGLAREIGDRVSLTEAQTGVSGEYFIVGEQHEVFGDNFHEVTWVLRQKSAAVFWLLGDAGFSELGDVTTLGV